MVRPASFGFNIETAGSNVFQRPEPSAASERRTLVTPVAAMCEFDAVAAALESAGVLVALADDTPEPIKPDAIFPNNWITFHSGGTVVLYPMLAANRRLERRDEVLREASRLSGFRVGELIDLCDHEAHGRFLEGTGSLVLDRRERVAYACLSPRTHFAVLADFAQRLGFEAVAFQAASADGTAIYHTNVMMSIGTHFAVMCSESIADESQRRAVKTRLEHTGRDVIDISVPQMHGFAANILELETSKGPLIAMSASAANALSRPELARLEKYAALVSVPIPTIEQLGGGSIRCMLAEIPLA